MKKKLLSLFVLVTLAVGITVAANYAPGNGLKFTGKNANAEIAATLQTDQKVKANTHKNGAVAQPKSEAEDWGEWEIFAPGGSNDAVWTLTAWQVGKLNVKTYVRTSTTDATKKQVKCTGWGAGMFTAEGVDILLDWNTTDNTIEIPMQSIGYYVSNYQDYAVVGSVETGNYDPEQGKFTFHVCYSIPQYYVMEQGFGFGDETLQMAGQFKDYSLSISRGNVDDEATPIKQTVNVNMGKDITNYRVHVSTYESYAAANGSVAYLDSLAKADGTEYTGSSATVDLQGSDYNIYIVVVSAFVNGEMKKYEYGVYEVSPASDWETIGTRPYREDIVTSIYGFGITGPVYDVEVQKHKTKKDIYRIKNPYGSATPFGNYTLYENAYLYLDARDSTNVYPLFQATKCDLGIDIEGGVPLDLCLANNKVGGTFDGYAISFPTRGLVSNNYYVNTNGLFRAVINFRDPVVALADSTTSVLVKETVKITSDNKFNTPTFESLTPEIATVDATGVVTGVAPGVAKIKVTQAADLEFNAVDTVLEITIEKNEFVYGDFIFNTDEGLAALGIEKPGPGSATNLTDMTLQSGVVSMTLTDGTNPTRVWNASGTTDLRMYKSGGSFTFSVPEGYSLVSMDFTGTDCSMFGEESEFDTRTKAHTVWNAPEGETVTSKEFEAVGTCKISVIKVKVATAGCPTGINEISNFQTANTEGIFNLHGQKVSTMRPGNIYIVNGKKVLVK